MGLGVDQPNQWELSTERSQLTQGTDESLDRWLAQEMHAELRSFQHDATRSGGKQTSGKGKRERGHQSTLY
jgi:hypothetical protein